jgi:hypothetical protein
MTEKRNEFEVLSYLALITTLWRRLPFFGACSYHSSILEYRKQDSGWTVRWATSDVGYDIEVYTECLKVINE